jgi:hypothetical protein
MMPQPSQKGYLKPTEVSSNLDTTPCNHFTLDMQTAI